MALILSIAMGVALAPFAFLLLCLAWRVFWALVPVFLALTVMLGMTALLITMLGHVR